MRVEYASRVVCGNLTASKQERKLNINIVINQGFKL